jgi:hypothetical protein
MRLVLLPKVMSNGLRLISKLNTHPIENNRLWVEKYLLIVRIVDVNYSQGLKLLDSDFQYEKLQLYYKQPIIIGPLGRSNVIVESWEKLWHDPLGLMNVIPGNQTCSLLQYI